MVPLYAYLYKILTTEWRNKDRQTDTWTDRYFVIIYILKSMTPKACKSVANRISSKISITLISSIGYRRK